MMICLHLLCVVQMISTGMSSKILKEALIQQREILEEADESESKRNGFVFKEEEESKRNVEEEEEDIDEFGGFNDTQSQFGNYEVFEFVFIY